jgi:hypothetical protein
MKTLKELWQENNCQPFWARHELSQSHFYMQALALNEIFALGSRANGDSDRWDANIASWTLSGDPREPVPKPKEKLVLWRCTQSYNNTPSIFGAKVGETTHVLEGTLIASVENPLPSKFERVSLSELLEGE